MSQHGDRKGLHTLTAVLDMCKLHASFEIIANVSRRHVPSGPKKLHTVFIAITLSTLN